MKVLIYIALHKRQEIAQVYYSSLVKFIIAGREAGVECEPLFIWSNDNDRATAEKYFPKAAYVYSENFPLGRKLNAGLPLVMSKDWTYFMGFGADDIILPEYWDKVIPHMNERKMCIGMQRLLCYDLSTGRVKLVGPTPMVYGAGRLLLRKYVEAGAYRYTVKCKHTNTAGDRRGKIKTIPQWQYKDVSYEMIDTTIELWPPEKNNAMDAASFMRIMKGYGPSMTWVQTAIDKDDLFCLDIKTEDNINKFDKLPGVILDGQAADEVIQKFGL